MEKTPSPADLVRKVIGADTAHNPAVYITRQKTNEPVKTWDREISVPAALQNKEVHIAFIDHMPKANFEHRVEYAFIDVDSGSIEIVKSSMPPEDLEENYHRVNL